MRLFVAMLATVVSISAPLSAQERPDAVVIQLAQSPGGLVANTLEVVARHLPAFLPGNPDVSVQRVPGAAGLNLLRRIEASDTVDGSVIGVSSVSHIVANRMDPETGIHGRFRFIGALSSEPSICMVHQDRNVTTAEELISTPMNFAAMSPTSSNYIDTAIIRNALGAEINIITGFQGGAEAMMALQRGEVDGGCGLPLYSFLRSPFAAQTRVIGYLGPTPSDEFIGQAGESLNVLISSQLDKDAITFLTSGKSALFSFWLHPETPQDVVDTYSAALNAMANDPAFQDEISRVIPALSPSTGEEIELLVKQISEAPDDVVQRARELSR